MAASVWSGYLTFGLISMPVRLFSGARSSGISFNMLHRDDLQRVKQQYYCPADNRVVERSEIVKGYEFRKDEYVVIEPEEIKKIEPQTAKTMEILEFVKTSEVDPVFFESSYYMLPEEAGRRPYALLTKALEESEYVAIAKLTMHNREYTVFLRPARRRTHAAHHVLRGRSPQGGRLRRARCRIEGRGSQSRSPADRSPGRRMGPGKISRHLPGKCEEAD
jgi:DNA end-binding protein Ku